MVDKKLVFGLFLVASISLVLMMSTSFAAIKMVAPANYSNNTKTNILFNVSYINATDITTPRNVTILASPNNNGTWLTIGTSSTNGCTVSANACWFTLNFSSIPDGNYSLNATFYNGTAGATISIDSPVNLSTSVIFDANAPGSVNFTSPLSGQNKSSTFTINLSIADTASSIRSVFINITNSTSGTQNFTGFATRESNSVWSLSFNPATVLDQEYNITLVVNDTLNQQNTTAVASKLRFDQSAPSASFSCTPTTASTSETISCSCSGSDTLTSIGSTTYTANPSTAETGTFTTSCTVENTAGLSTVSQITYTVNQPPAAGSGGSGGGGGGAGGSSSEKKTSNTFTSVSQGSAAVAKYTDKDYGLKEITINVNNPAQNVKVTVTKYAGKPAEVTVEKTGKVYKYLQINVDNIAGKLSNAVVRIQVEKSWVAGNGLTKENVALHKFVNGKWEEQTTTFSGEDATNYYYDTTLTSFSYFSIA